MTRMSKQNEKRTRFPRKRKAPSPKTGAKKDVIPGGFIQHLNAIEGACATSAFIGKVK